MRAIADSRVTRRIRAESRVQIAACEGDGWLLGDRSPARAQRVTADEAIIAVMEAILDEKSGEERLAMTRIFANAWGRRFEWIEIDPNSPNPDHSTSAASTDGLTSPMN